VARDIPTYSFSPRAVAYLGVIDAEHDGGTFQSLAAEDVTVEDLLLVPERLPVGLLTEQLRLLDLYVVTLAGRTGRRCRGTSPTSRTRSTAGSAVATASVPAGTKSTLTLVTLVAGRRNYKTSWNPSSLVHSMSLIDHSRVLGHDQDLVETTNSSVGRPVEAQSIDTD